VEFAAGTPDAAPHASTAPTPAMTSSHGHEPRCPEWNTAASSSASAVVNGASSDRHRNSSRPTAAIASLCGAVVVSVDRATRCVDGYDNDRDRRDVIRTWLDVSKMSPLSWAPAETSIDGDLMPNERLRAALLERGITPAQLAEDIDVDLKTVERWISTNRLPYRRHRFSVAAKVGLDEAYLWPDALTRDQVASASESEIINIYPARWAVPSDLWRAFFDNAEEDLGVLAYSGMFIPENAGILRLFRQKADAGATVRILIGDPNSEEVAQRGIDEGIDVDMAARCRVAVVLYQPLRGIDGIELRLHSTILYNSIYRADDQLLVNTHVYGTPASHAPVLHLRKVAGGDMVTTYQRSFDRVWDGATPLE
jgi:hypothetical protein